MEAPVAAGARGHMVDRPGGGLGRHSHRKVRDQDLMALGVAMLPISMARRVGRFPDPAGRLNSDLLCGYTYREAGEIPQYFLKDGE